MIDWIKKALREGTDVSLSRHLMALLVLVVCAGLLVEAKTRGIGAAWATVATGLATTLAGLWGVGKWRRNQDGQ